MEEIIARLEAEMEESTTEYVATIGKIAISHIKTCQSDAFRVTPDKTLQGCFEFMMERARKNQNSGCGVTSDADVFDYFGFAGAIQKPQADADIKPANINIADLFD